MKYWLASITSLTALCAASSAMASPMGSTDQRGILDSGITLAAQKYASAQNAHYSPDSNEARYRLTYTTQDKEGFAWKVNVDAATDTRKTSNQGEAAVMLAASWKL